MPLLRVRPSLARYVALCSLLTVPLVCVALAGGVAGHFWTSEHWDALPLPHHVGYEGRSPRQLGAVGRGLAVVMRF